ncbi:hypothetical protein [Ramlibacter tataouinensis]|uniref:Uncharacterized protein n=1 Tax=Ramlibacter tataouinensis (strain ATCC BAA-407 / DSM 14655 / LMG 21543 / TTB310) TaxID=365046 RepID=F5XVX8_RAMTT|nr:hypothetical protein [Ramlibacter tataouinensis]AEG94081.1 hypothetical protein Rta_29770 [Ramlibacter tataouinensis TTB310]
MQHVHLHILGLGRRPVANDPAPGTAAPPAKDRSLPGRCAGLPPPRAAAATLTPATLTPATAADAFAARQPLTASLGKLASMRDRMATPAAEPRVLASVDLAADLPTRHVTVPLMTVSVTCDDPRLLGGYGGSREDLVLQRLQLKAFESIQDASREVKSAIREFDASVAQRPPASPREAAERQRTFESACRGIASAQQAKIEQAVQREWSLQKQRDLALRASNARFGVRLTMQAVSVAANAGTAVLLPNPISPAKAAYSLVRMAQTVKQFTKDREQAAQSIVKGDAALARLQAGEVKEGGGGRGWRTRARELVSAVHIPFTQELFRSVHHQEEKLDEFLAKSARVDRQAQQMYAQANELMETLRKLPAPPPGQPDAHSRLRSEADALLGELGELMRSVERDNAFYREYQGRCRAYRAQQPVGLARQADQVDMAAMTVRIGRFAGNLAKIAAHLAP